MNKSLLIELLNGGCSHAQAAETLGCSRSAVSIAAKKLGLVPCKAQKRINVELLRSEVAGGMSFTVFSRKYGHTLAAVSRAAAKNGIVTSSTLHLPKELPDQEMYDKYVSGTSVHALQQQYGVPQQTIKRHLLKVNGRLRFRSMDEAIRPAVLNDRAALLSAIASKSYRTIARELGVKLSTVTRAARKFNLDFNYVARWDMIDHGRLLDMYLVQMMTPSRIAFELGYPYLVVLRQLKAYGFPIAKQGGTPRPSKYQQLDDRQWLADRYAVSSANSIAVELGTSAGMVLYHLRKHDILVRSKEEYLPLIMDHVHGIKAEFGGIHCHSQLEKAFLQSLSTTDGVERNIRLEDNGSYCLIDFCVDGQLVEVKPKEVLVQAGPDRRRMVKQYLICKNNHRHLKVWTKSGEWDGSISDDDILHAMNWKLIFRDAGECCNWLLGRGFVAPRHSYLDLADSAAKMQYCAEGQQLNANYNNHHPLKLTTHFFPHFWRSTHLDYLPISAAWGQGNASILRSAVAGLWERKQEVSVYGLLKYIARFFKDFTTVSWFKPWIAAYVYDRYLPNGGVVVDPSCGWGGRFMGSLGRGIEYIGYDLNALSVESHRYLCSFLGRRVDIQPTFVNADSSTCSFTGADLIFTSPPYNSTELYHGIDSLRTETMPIITNIFRQARCDVVLNVPLRLELPTINAANGHGYTLFERLDMRTNSFIGRVKTLEPILVFRRG